SIYEQRPWEGALFDFGLAEHPRTDYFNPSLVDRPDGTWLVTRRSAWEDRLRFGMNDVMAFALDGTRPTHGIKLKCLKTAAKEQFEDPRAIYHAGRTWVSMCNFEWYRTKKWTGAHQVLIEFNHDWNQLRRHDIPYGKNGKGLGLNTGHEKNWLWF